MSALPQSNKWLFGWWTIWACVLAQQLALHSWHGPWLEDNPAFSRVTYAAVLSPLVLSVVLRWVLWPRLSSVGVSFGVFAVGLILASVAGLSVSFLSVPYRQVTFAVCLGGILEFAPLRRGAAINTPKAPNHSPEPAPGAVH